jgi:hypothetical protein
MCSSSSWIARMVKTALAFLALVLGTITMDGVGVVVDRAAVVMVLLRR